MGSFTYLGEQRKQPSFWQSLTGFGPNTYEWSSTKPLDEVNEKFQSLGYEGNIGSRQKFKWQEEDFYLVESQKCLNCWGGWRIVLCDS